jgi:hypothetical protein
MNTLFTYTNTNRNIIAQVAVDRHDAISHQPAERINVDLNVCNYERER